MVRVAPTAATSQVKPRDPRVRDLAAIHVAAAALGMDTADTNPQCEYRSMLQQVGGATSSARLTATGRARVVAHLQALLAKRNGAAPPSPHHRSQADKIETLWRELADLGALRDPSPAGLNVLVRKLTGLASARFLPADQANKVIEALKAMRTRAQAKARPHPQANDPA